MDHVSGIASEKSPSYLRLSRLSPMLSSRSFIALSFTFKTDPFEVTFREGCKLCVCIHFFACGCPVVQAPFVENVCLYSSVLPLFLCQRSLDYSDGDFFVGSLMSFIFLSFCQYYTVLIAIILW